MLWNSSKNQGLNLTTEKYFEVIPITKAKFFDNNDKKQSRKYLHLYI